MFRSGYPPGALLSILPLTHHRHIKVLLEPYKDIAYLFNPFKLMEGIPDGVIF
jgi:hypothetical protein